MPSRICAWLGSGGGGAKIRSARAEKYLTLTAAGSELKANAVRAGATTVMSHALMFGMHVVSTIILARLLTPRDFGLVTMVTTLSLFLQNIGANGFTEAIIQRDRKSVV